MDAGPIWFMDDNGYLRFLDARRAAFEGLHGDAECAVSSKAVDQAEAQSRFQLGEDQVIKTQVDDDGAVCMYTQTDGSGAMTGWPYSVPKTPYQTQVAGNHYENMKIQPHEYIVKNGIGWSAGNAIKYLSRYKRKGGADDVKKAIHYCQLLLAEEYGE